MSRIHLDKERETLFIPLYGKALMSRAGQLITDKTAERIVGQVDYNFSQNRMPKGLQVYMAVRACILDDYANAFLKRNQNGVIVHLGCGLDARCERLLQKPGLFVDLDFPEVIEVRRLFYTESDSYQMIGRSATDPAWPDEVRTCDAPTLVIAEGMTMYLTEREIRDLVLRLRARFADCELAFDAYSLGSVRMSKRHNPVNKMGATIRWGLDDPKLIEAIAPGIQHLSTRYFTDYPGLSSLPLGIRAMFRLFYKNPIVKNMYRIYAFRLAGQDR